MTSGNINTRNTEKDITVDLNVHFFLPCFPDHTFQRIVDLHSVFIQFNCPLKYKYTSRTSYTCNIDMVLLKLRNKLNIHVDSLGRSLP